MTHQPVPRAPEIVVDGVSRFYGEVLGVNNVSLEIDPGITSLVGSNGAGKTTLLNLLAGLIRPTSGTIRVSGSVPGDTEFPNLVGYSTQFDAFPKGLRGGDYLRHRLQMFGVPASEAQRRTGEMLERIGLEAAAGKKISAYSKGMRQRLQLAAALIHDPRVLVLDEPLNGLDPVGRAEFIELFRTLAGEGRYVLISSHILEEVDQISDHVVMMNHGYVVAEGRLQAVRDEIPDQPTTLFIGCSRPRELARLSFQSDQIVEARISHDPSGVVIRTRDRDGYFALLGRIVVEEGLDVDQVSLTDDDTFSVYGYLVGEGS